MKIQSSVPWNLVSDNIYICTNTYFVSQMKQNVFVHMTIIIDFVFRRKIAPKMGIVLTWPRNYEITIFPYKT